MKRRRGIKSDATLKQRAWWSSPRFKEMGRTNCRRFNAKQRYAPKCEAARRTDGQPCQKPAGPNGRCRFHGGATPSGRRYHVPVLPKANTPAGAAKFNRKLADLDRRARKRAERLAAMTPEERDRHEAWHLAHRPGPKGQRKAAKVRAEQDNEIRALLAAPAVDVVSPELQALRDALAEIEREIEQDEQPIPTVYEEDVFS